MLEKINLSQLNESIRHFPRIFPVTEDMNMVFSGVSRITMLDRYSFKDVKLLTLKEGDLVTLVVKEDPEYPSKGYGIVKNVNRELGICEIEVDEEFHDLLENEGPIIKRKLNMIEKPLEVTWEQLAKRVSNGLASVEKNSEDKKAAFERFYEEMVQLNIIPAGRVLFAAGTDILTTYFNCFVMPFPHDSREGIGEHRKKVMEIMSRGGGVGTNISTLRPRNALARTVNGRSSGAVSWLQDLSVLTGQVSQGGSRRGAQMGMMISDHPDIIEFIISKMQNPQILRVIIATTEDEDIKKLAQEKLKFTPLTKIEKDIYSRILQVEPKNSPLYSEASKKLEDGGVYSVHNPDYLSGMNISVCLTREFMEALENDEEYALRFPDVDSYNEEEMENYNTNWHKIGDVREWEKLGNRVKVYKKIRAKELWNLINICATYSGEPGIFFFDNANDMTNAKAYGQKVVATNPCGEQPLSAWSTCNLLAINLSTMANPKTKQIDFKKLERTVRTAVRLGDNVIDATPYFLEEVKEQSLRERRIGIGVMGLHDALIYCEKVYGSEEGNRLIDQIFYTIATTAYSESIEIAKEKGSFPFLIGKNDEETMKLRQAFINTGYMKRMPEEIRQNILKYGIRNSHLLTVAPTGTTGTMINVSTGLEPYYSFSYKRSGRLGKDIIVQAKVVQEYLKANPSTTELPKWFVSAMDLPPKAHVDVQCIIQRWVDSSISKTVNAPKGYSIKQVQEVYEMLYKGGAKGGTVYVDGSRDSQVLSLLLKEEKKSEEEMIEKRIGMEIGDTCPICKEGTVIVSNGCSTCSDCGTQLKCGL